MEDSEGVLNFDFEGGLDAQPSAATAITSTAAVSTPIVQSDSYLPPSNGAATAAPSVAEHVPGNAPGRRSFRQTVCRHWLRSLCMKGEACGFLHQYDKARMPICRFFRLYGECREQDCVYKHTNDDIKECNMYVFCFLFFFCVCVFIMWRLILIFFLLFVQRLGFDFVCVCVLCY